MYISHVHLSTPLILEVGFLQMDINYKAFTMHVAINLSNFAMW